MGFYYLCAYFFCLQMLGSITFPERIDEMIFLMVNKLDPIQMLVLTVTAIINTDTDIYIKLYIAK